MATDGVMLPVTGRTGSPARSANPANPANPVSPARAHATVNGTMCRRKACAAARIRWRMQAARPACGRNTRAA